MEDEIIQQMKETGLYYENDKDAEEDKKLNNLAEVLTEEASQAIKIFKTLPDNAIVSLTGVVWLGKFYTSLADIMELYYVSDPIRVFQLIQVCSEEYASWFNKHVNKKGK